MIRGTVELTGMISTHPVLAPRVPVAVAAGINGVFRTVEATVDTGFTAWLTLPVDIIRELGLLYQGSRRVTLASGSTPETDLYLGFISWNGRILPRVVHRSDGNPLLGLGLLLGHRLTVEAVIGGEVIIDEIESGSQ